MFVLIDGDCALCVGLVEWMGNRIPAELLKPEHISFIPGESDWGHDLRAQFGIENFDSVVVIDQGRAFSQSNAVLALATVLPCRWRFVAFLVRMLPRRMRDALYRFVALNRFSWFGRKEQCPIAPRVAPVVYGPRGNLDRPK